jgi:hypothetical protein
MAKRITTYAIVLAGVFLLAQVMLLISASITEVINTGHVTSQHGELQ